MGEENEDKTGSGGSGNADTGKAFTQADLDRIAAKEKDEGKRAGERALLEALGMSNVDDLKAVLNRVKAEDDKNLTEAQKAKKEADEAAAKAQSAEAKANERLIEAEKVIALAEAGVNHQRLRGAMKLMELDEAGSPDKAKTAAEQVKKDYPEFFKEIESGDDKAKGSGPGTPPPPRDTGQPRHKGDSSGNSPDKTARAILERRHPKLAKNKE